MKSYRHLYPQLCTWENLHRAWRKARLGKRDNVALMFVGYTKIGEAWHFAVVDRKSGKSTWMRMDVDYEGVMIEKFDEAAQTIHLTVGGLGVELTLVKE